MKDLVDANVEASRIPLRTGDSLLPKLFAEYKYSAWDTATLRRGDLVDAYDYNRPPQWREKTTRRSPWARIDKLEEHMGGVKDNGDVSPWH